MTDTSIEVFSNVRTKDTETFAIAPLEYSELQIAYNFFNARLFDGKLPSEVMFNYTRKPGMLGHYADERYSGRVREGTTSEIALNPDTFISQTDEQIGSTLVHEMVHQCQHRFGKPGARGYHNKEWATLMKAIGLMPSNTGAVGGKETGQQMDHYILPGGPYQQAFAELAATGWKLNLQSAIYAGGAKKKDDSKTKFTCPTCDCIIRGKPDTKMFCEPCFLGALEGCTFNEGQAGFIANAIRRATMLPER